MAEQKASSKTMNPRSTDSYDVKFLVGSERNPIEAHKFILAGISDVFNRMFYSDFPSENDIVIEDVDNEAFKVMVNCIYGRDFEVNAENVANVYYAAEKYNLNTLRKFCTSFVVTIMINDTNALTVLNTFCQYNNPAITEKCLSIIFDNPNRYLLTEEFAKSSADVVRSICKPRHINCSVQNIKAALVTWTSSNKLTEETTFNEAVYKVVENNLQLKANEIDHKIGMEHMSFIPGSYYYMIRSSTDKFLVKGERFLHGFGLVMGIQGDFVEKEPVTVSLHKQDQNAIVTETIKDKEKILVEKTNPKNCITVQDVYFDNKVLIKLGRSEFLGITVEFDSDKLRACFHGNSGSCSGLVSHLIMSDLQ